MKQKRLLIGTYTNTLVLNGAQTFRHYFGWMRTMRLNGYGGDLVVFEMNKADCRWIKERKK
jgi:hypothetical protein